MAAVMAAMMAAMMAIAPSPFASQLPVVKYPTADYYFHFWLSLIFIFDWI